MNSQGRRASLLVPEHNEPLLIGQFKFWINKQIIRATFKSPFFST
jgi:hypothetical protein